MLSCTRLPSQVSKKLNWTKFILFLVISWVSFRPVQIRQALVTTLLLMHAHSWDGDDAESTHQLTFPQTPLYLLTPTCYPDMWRKISLLTVEQSQILTPGFSHLTVKWVCVSAAVPYSAPLRLSVCLYETEERQTMERHCCKVAPSAWRCWKVEKRICSVAHLKSRAAGRRPTLQFFQVTGRSEGSSKSGSEGGD